MTNREANEIYTSNENNATGEFHVKSTSHFTTINRFVFTFVKILGQSVKWFFIYDVTNFQLFAGFPRIFQNAKTPSDFKL